MKHFNPAQPIYVGLGGVAGTGKTSTAKRIVPASSASSYGDVSPSNNELDALLWEHIGSNPFPKIVWDHYWFAMPLYDMYNARVDIQGEDKKDRTLYAIHDVVNSLMSKGIPYDDMVELVYDIYSFPLQSDLNEKPRTFLQLVGDLCRAQNPDCFANYIKYKVYDRYRTVMSEYSRADEDEPWFISIVSDLRMPNEAEMLKSRTNNILIKFICEDKVRAERIEDRDGKPMDASQQQHKSETSLALIPDEMYDLILDTTDMTLKEQATAVYTYIVGNLIEKVD